MRVMTFNLRTDSIFDIRNPWKSRKTMVNNIIAMYNPDILGVQELNNSMFKDLSESLKEQYNMVGEARTKNLFAEKNDILVKKSHRIKSHTTFWLSSEPERVGSSQWHSLFPRICTTALIEMECGKMVRVYNTHLDCISPWARDYGLKKISEIIEENYESEKVPVMLMGDFNATPHSKTIKNFIALNKDKRNFIAVQEINKDMYSESTMSKFKGATKGMHIDYIFVSDEFNVMSSEIVRYNENGKYPSDHYPLVAELTL